MLEVGTDGLTYGESRAHFSLWCMIAAPLIAGNDVRHMKPEYQAMMTDKDVLAIDQDALGKQGFRALADPGKNIEIWVRELSHGEWAVCALNTNAAATEITVEWNRLWTIQGAFKVQDVWAKKPAGDNSKAYTAKVDSHDVLLFRLTPVKP
jgi:alpha-galactosidase